MTPLEERAALLREAAPSLVDRAADAALAKVRAKLAAEKDAGDAN